jgi:hypothetical protein
LLLGQSGGNLKTVSDTVWCQGRGVPSS